MTKPVVICVDDEPAILESLKVELKRILGEECLVETAEGGAEALELLSELQQDDYEVALVLSDYIMPDIKGDELLKQIHDRSPQTLKIMVTGQADLAAVGNAIRHAKLYRYLPKPWSSEDLRMTVVEAVHTYLQDRKLETQNVRLQQTNQELHDTIVHLKQLEADLQRSEVKLNEILNSAIAVIVSLRVYENREWEYEYFSAGCQLLYGYSATELMADKTLWISRVLPEDRSVVALPYREIFAEESTTNEYRFRRRDHTVRWIAGTLTSRYDPCIGCWLVTIVDTDITERKQLESLLRSQAERERQFALQQLELHRQTQQINADLEHQVNIRTSELRMAYETESTLKQITEKVRDSLDENQILQSAVEALAQRLGVGSCNAALFDLEQGTSTIRFEATNFIPPSQGRVSRMADFREIYDQLLQGWHFQFCSLILSPSRGKVSMLVCPISDDKGVLGDLWLVNQADCEFGDREINLVQHVATQCAIALRQALLFQKAQAQVADLERLNQMKDDFLSTVSHELRSPLSNIKMAIQMLDLTLGSPGGHGSSSGTSSDRPVNALSPNADRYLQILKDECQREINLVNDLLDLARLDAQTDLPIPILVDLKDWMTRMAQPFAERALSQEQQFTLDLADDLPYVQTDLSDLERIVSELLNNACKYTPSQGKITVEVRADDEVTIRVVNTGMEIPDDERDRIFDKFYRIPQNDPWKHGGTGLGLALVKKLTERLGAQITVSSSNHQTVFLLKLPLVEAAVSRK
ncbi:MAG: ATP-binding protein [Oculatellaceae cyanobacterium Prado106]|nr:ATP-binding protein [Oculatellaceae cyanobacterium Prado106]